MRPVRSEAGPRPNWWVEQQVEGRRDNPTAGGTATAGRSGEAQLRSWPGSAFAWSGWWAWWAWWHFERVEVAGAQHGPYP